MVKNDDKMKRNLPDIIKQVGFDFSWDEKKVWQLDYPAEEMPTSELTWHLDIPFIWSKPNGYYDIKPSEVINQPEKFREEYERTMQADMSYPIDVMCWKERWLILDGLHRLMKLSIQGKEIVSVRKIPQSAIPKILKG